MTDKAHVITANRLADGIAVFWTGGGWSERFSEATYFTDAGPEASALDHAARDVEARVVVDPYAFDVVLEAGQARPLRQRERIRSAGAPTVGGSWVMTAHY